MKRTIKRNLYAAVILLLLILGALVVIAAVYGRGDTFHPASTARRIVWMAKRTVAQAASLPFAVWDPYRDGLRTAVTAPACADVSRSSPGDGGAQIIGTGPLPAGGARVTSALNRRLPETRYPFMYQPFEEHLLDSLRVLYGLDRIRAKHAGQPDQLLLRAVSSWLHSEARSARLLPREKIPEVDFNFNALDILHRMNRGERFWCSEYSTTLVQCLAALGHTARYVMINSDTGGHVLCEAWSNSLDKWIMLDPFFDRSVTLAGEPLNVLEIHRLLLNPGDMRRAVVREHGELMPRGSDREFYMSLFVNLAVRMRNDWFSNPLPRLHPLSTSVMNAVEWQDGITEDLVYYSRETGRESDLYWPLNHTRLGLEGSTNGGLELRFETFTPGFSHFSVRVDSLPPARLDSCTFSWRLSAGGNHLEVRSVNSAGVAGPGSVLTVMVPERQARAMQGD